MCWIKVLLDGWYLVARDFGYHFQLLFGMNWVKWTDLLLSVFVRLRASCVNFSLKTTWQILNIFLLGSTRPGAPQAEPTMQKKAAFSKLNSSTYTHVRRNWINGNILWLHHVWSIKPSTTIVIFLPKMQSYLSLFDQLIYI